MGLKQLRRFVEKHLLFCTILFVSAYFLWRRIHVKHVKKMHLHTVEPAIMYAEPSSVLEPPGSLLVPEVLSVKQIAPETLPAEAPIVLSDEQVMQLLEISDRFMCSIEMATFLAIMQIGGSQRLLSYQQQLNVAMQHSLQRLAQTCRDELEFVLLLYALGSPSEQHTHLQAPDWTNAFLRYSLQAYTIEFERDRLLAHLAMNKSEPEQRMLNFNLLDRVRIILIYYLSNSSEEMLATTVSIKSEWLDWLRQTPRTPIELAQFISLHTRTQTGSLVENALHWHFSSEPDLSQANNYAWMEIMHNLPPVPTIPITVLAPPTKHLYETRDTETQILATYHIGDLITVEVEGVQDYGAFVKTEADIKGLIHKSKVWGNPDHARDYFRIGEVIRASIWKIDMERRRLELSMLLPEYDPLLKYQPGDTAMAKITDFLKYGMKVEVEPGVRGLVHCSDMDRSLADMQALFAIGDEMEVLVIRVDMEKRHLSLADATQV